MWVRLPPPAQLRSGSGRGVRDADTDHRWLFSLQQVQRWERSGTNPTVASLKRYSGLLGRNSNCLCRKGKKETPKRKCVCLYPELRSWSIFATSRAESPIFWARASTSFQFHGAVCPSGHRTARSRRFHDEVEQKRAGNKYRRRILIRRQILRFPSGSRDQRRADPRRSRLLGQWRLAHFRGEEFSQKDDPEIARPEKSHLGRL